MGFDELVDRFHNRFPKHGRFDLLPGESINDVVRRESVPEEGGAYLIFDAPGCSGDVIYIGRSGTIKQDGTRKAQGLRKRLTMKQDGMFRRFFFQRVIEESAPKGLSFEWFITFDHTQKVLPALPEAELLQAFFEKYGMLPRLNKEF